MIDTKKILKGLTLSITFLLVIILIDNIQLSLKNILLETTIGIFLFFSNDFIWDSDFFKRKVKPKKIKTQSTEKNKKTTEKSIEPKIKRLSYTKR
jgi:hypothetical protein